MPSKDKIKDFLMSDKIWLEQYPPGVPAEINLNTYTSLADLFEKSCVKYADKAVASNYGSELSYKELEKLSGYFAAYLQQTLKLKKGDRLGLMMPNVMQYLVAMYAGLRIGLVIVNINPLYTSREVAKELLDAGIAAVVVIANFANTLQDALAGTQVKHIIVTEIGDLLGFPKAYFYNFTLRYIKKLVPSYHFEKSVSFKNALAEGEKLGWEKAQLTHEDIAFLQYTGGTTGVPKAAVLTHGNMVANVEQAYSWVTSGTLQDGEEMIVAPLPLYHIFTLTVCAMCFLKMGATVVLITNPRDVDQFVKTLNRLPFTVLVGINTLLNMLLRHSGFTPKTFAHLKMVVVGGMPLQEKIANDWYKATGLPVLEGYGLTEASPIVTINPTTVAAYTGSIGLPVPSTIVSIRGEDGKELPIGQIGEICVKGPQVMREYWQQPEETKKVFTADGWLLTGDMGYCDEQGYFYIKDRKKELILVSGFKVYPNEVEDVIMHHPGVAEVAVIGVPHPVSGEAVKAFVVKKDPSLTSAKLITYCHENLTRYKVPKKIEFVANLPKSNIGKVLRRELREQELKKTTVETD